MLFSLQLGFTVWDGKILTESLSVSIGISSFALLFLCFEKKWPLGLSILLAILTFLLMNLRDSMAYLLLPAAILSFIFVVKADSRKVFFGAGVFLLAAIVGFGMASSTATLGKRSGVVFTDLWTYRLNKPQEIRDYFVKQGIPPAFLTIVSPKDPVSIFAVTNRLTHPPVKKFLFENPEVIPWLAKRAKSLYLKFLMSHPSYVLSMLVNEKFFAGWLAVPHVYASYLNYGLPAFRDMPKLINFFSFYATFWLFVIATLLLVSVLIFFLFWRTIIRDCGFVFAASGAAFSFFYAFMVWLAEPQEVMRHELFAFVLLGVSLIAMFLRCLDGLWSSYQQKNGAIRHQC